MRSHGSQTILCALAACMLPCTAAQAALVNDYTQSDDVWNPPLAPGHSLLDARVSYTTSTQNPVLLPAASLVFGLATGLEGGVWIGDWLTGPGIALSDGHELLNPYVKYQLPWKAGATVFGLVGGVQLPTVSTLEHDIALEGVASTALSSDWTLDFGLGIGRQFVVPATLGHVNANLSYALPNGQSVFVETYALVSSVAPAIFGEHVGYSFPLGSRWTWDVGLALNESAGTGVSGFSPQLGTTLKL